MPNPLNSELIKQIRNEMQFADTVDLVEIWQTDDPSAWTAEGLEAVRSLLEERLGPIPLQAQSAHWKAGSELRAQRHLERAQAWEAKGKYEQALAECQAAIRLAPQLAAAHNQLGLMLDAQDQPVEAMAAYRAALRLDPDFAEARDNLADALREWSSHGGAAPPKKNAPVPDDPLLSGEYVEGGDLPETFYLDDTARLLPGWPGYRTRQGRSGYDYLDTQFELAHMEGVWLRQLLTGRLRTHSLAGLILLAFIGTVALLPLLLGGAAVASGDPSGVALIIILSPSWALGLLLLWNVVRNAFEWEPDE